MSAWRWNRDLSSVFPHIAPLHRFAVYLTFLSFLSIFYTNGEQWQIKFCMFNRRRQRSWRKHWYTKDDIERAIETKIYEDTLKGEDDIYVIIGFDTVANPIEVFYNIIDDETIRVFHAMALRDKTAAQMN